MDGCRGCKTRARSGSSRLTGDGSSDFACQDVLVTESTSTQWTDEKHSLYLKSMETSFVNQLYNSMDHLGWCSQNDMSVPQLIQNQNPSAPSGKFKVLRGGCWEKINFHKPGLQPSTSNESHIHLKSPWIQHFRSSRKSQDVASPAIQKISSSLNVANVTGKSSVACGAATTSKHTRSCHSSRCHHLVDNNAEVSDQNFVDEDKATSACSSKRRKTPVAEASSSDQVVPFGKLPLTED